MTLKAVVDTLDGMDDAIKALYIEDNGKFRLDVDGHAKNEDPNRIPKSRLDAEIEKRKAGETALKEVAEQFVESIPEDMRELIPDLPPAAKIKWIQQANAKGLFDAKTKEPIDAKRPNDKKPTNFEGMSPQAIMATGYKTTK